MEKPVVDFSKLPKKVLEEYGIKIYSSYEEVFNDLYLDDNAFSIRDVVELLKDRTMQEVIEAEPYMYKFGDMYYRFTDMSLIPELAEKYPAAVVAKEDAVLPWVKVKSEPETFYKGNYAEVRQQIMDAYHSDDVELAMLLNNLGTNLSLSDAFQLYADLRQEIDGDKTLCFLSSSEIHDVSAPDLISPEELSKRISDFIPKQTAYEHLCEFIAHEVPTRMMFNDIEASDEDMAKLIRIAQGNTAIMFDHEGFDKFLIEKYREIKGLPLQRDNSWHKYTLSKEECDKFVDVMVSTIRGVGIENGSGYYGLKSFEVDGEKLNLFCEISEHLEEDGYDIYYAVEFDEGDTLFSDWEHVETKNKEELKKIIFNIVSTDYSEDVRVKLGLERQEVQHIDSSKVVRLGVALTDMRHEINGAAEFAPDLLPLKEKQYAILEIQHDAALNGVDINLSSDNIIDLEHLNCFWYGGVIGSLEYKGYTVSIEVQGDVNVSVLTDDCSDVLFSYKNKNNSGVQSHDEVFECIDNDLELETLSKEGRLAWENNNWVEFFVFDKDGNEVQVPMVETVLDDNVLEAFEDVGFYKKLIDEIEQKQTLKSQEIGSNRKLFILDDEIMINDDNESINCYLWAVDNLVDRLPSSESMDNINFYADYYIRTGVIKLSGSYYTPINGSDIQKTVVLPLSDAEKVVLIDCIEAYCQKEYKQSCLEFINEMRALACEPLIESVGSKAALSAQINSAENSKKSSDSAVKDIENPFEK